MNQKLIILRGNSGSGKSTVAKQLQLKMGYKTMLIPQDVVRRDILRVADTSDNPSGELVSILAHYGSTIGYDVIIEGIFSTKKYGDMIKHVIKNFNGKAYVYYFDISFEETLRRHASKANNTEFGEKEMKEWWNEKDYLGTKGEQYIPDTMSEDEIVEYIIQSLS